MTNILNDVIPALSTKAKFWVSYPKIASKIVSDLSKECQWDCLCKHGFDIVDQVDLDGVWTARSFTCRDNSSTSSGKLLSVTAKQKQVAEVM